LVKLEEFRRGRGELNSKVKTKFGLKIDFKSNSTWVLDFEVVTD